MIKGLLLKSRIGPQWFDPIFTGSLICSVKLLVELAEEPNLGNRLL
jgi:hypothetical protein